MGAMQNNVRAPKKSKGNRGSTRNDSRLEAFAGGKAPGSADWGGCDPKRIQAVLVGITALGGAATFGLSRDKGAHSLTLLLDDTRKSLWFNGDADLDDELDAVVATLAAMDE